MRRKLTITVFIVFSAFMLNVSTMAFQQRYDRRDEDECTDPHVIEMTDNQALKYLKNTWFFEFPLKNTTEFLSNTFFVEEQGFGQQYTLISQPFKTCHLKFVLINYLGFFEQPLPERTYKMPVS